MRSLSELLGLRVVTDAGWEVGRVVDLRVEEDEEAPLVVGVVVAPYGRRELLLAGRALYSHAKLGPHPAIPWDAVQKIERDRVVIDDTVAHIT